MDRLILQNKGMDILYPVVVKMVKNIEDNQEENNIKNFNKTVSCLTKVLSPLLNQISMSGGFSYHPLLLILRKLEKQGIKITNVLDQIGFNEYMDNVDRDLIEKQSIDNDCPSEIISDMLKINYPTNQIELCEIIFCDQFLGENRFDQMDFKNAMYKYTEISLKNLGYENILIDNKENIGGTFSYQNGKAILNYCDKIFEKQGYGNAFSNLALMFHELEHARQIKDQKIEQKNSYNILEQIKEKVIRGVLDDYKENYDNNRDEIEARIVGDVATLRFIKEKGLPSPPEYVLDNYRNLFKIENAKYLNNERTKENRKYNKDSMFLEIINLHPEYLDYFPQLNTVYNYDGNRVYEKSIEELTFEMEKLILKNKPIYELGRIRGFKTFTDFMHDEISLKVLELAGTTFEDFFDNERIIQMYKKYINIKIEKENNINGKSY